MSVKYTVERIEKKRVINGRTEYFLKWKGWPRTENTWEPEQHLHCPDLISDFEKKFELKNGKKHSILARVAAAKALEVQKKVGFARGFEPLKIHNADNSTGEIMFLMEWKGSPETDMVPAKEANMKCPQLVIKFYEERIVWIDDDDEMMKPTIKNAP